MGEERLPETLESQLDRALSGGERGAEITHRRLFREMVKGEIEDRPLSWSRRRALVRFAVRLGIDLFEARLVIRAVEYECGHVAPAAMADVETPVDADYVLRPDSYVESFRFAAVLLSGVLLCLVVFGLR